MAHTSPSTRASTVTLPPTLITSPMCGLEILCGAPTLKPPLKRKESPFSPTEKLLSPLRYTMRRGRRLHWPDWLSDPSITPNAMPTLAEPSPISTSPG